MSMETQFDPALVTTSVLVAIFASFVALNLVSCVTTAKGRSRELWLLCGALAMGIGIWSMHFIGMLAFKMPGITMAYDIPLMGLSFVVAIAGSALALFTISRSIVPLSFVLAGGTAMAAAIAGMHYIGMYSMIMEARITWNPYLVIASIAIALIASLGSLLILKNWRKQPAPPVKMLLASTFMGLAISGMHYVGMLAATFVHDASQKIDNSHLLVSSRLEVAVIVTTLVILGIALGSSVLQRQWMLASHQSEEQFRLLIDAIKEYAIIMLDPDGRIATWNAGAERLHGYSEKEVLGRHVSMFSTPENVKAGVVDTELRVALESGHFEGTGERVRKDGSVYVSSLVIAAFFDAEGKHKGFSKVTRDITADKAAERKMQQLNEELEQRVQARTSALAEREHQLRTITNAVPVLIAQVDTELRILFANDAFCQWFKRSDQELAGMTLSNLFTPHDYQLISSYLEKCLAGETVSFELESAVAQTAATFGVTFVPERDADGTVRGLILVASDITPQKAIQAELQHAKEAAEIANETKSAFLANMSHEIRTPLGAVLGFSELLFSGDLSKSERHNYMEVIKRNGTVLSNVINDILDLSKVEAGKLQVESTEVPFYEVMREIGSMLTLQARERGIDLKVVAEGFVPKTIKTDSLRLRQILFNIIGNAIKFTKRGSVTVTIKVQADSQLAFIVTDTGEGIPPEKIEHLFTPFTQADVSTTRKFGGTGLGLALSKRLANALGGDVYLERSVPGEGSTFVVTIDAGNSTRKAQVLYQSTSEVFHVNTTEFDIEGERPPDLSQLKVLVVDDSLDNLLLLKHILQWAGASVEMADNGRKAVDLAMNQDFSLVLMDLQMPEMDGYQATSTLRKRGFLSPIIALTAHAMKEEKQRALQSGFNQHITKPIDREALIRLLSEYVS